MLLLSPLRYFGTCAAAWPIVRPEGRLLIYSAMASSFISSIGAGVNLYFRVFLPFFSLEEVAVAGISGIWIYSSSSISFPVLILFFNLCSLLDSELYSPALVWM